MPAAETAAQFQLRDVFRALNALRYQLLGILSTLPPLEPAEGEDLAGPEAELRVAIECVLTDQILPAIVALAAALRLVREP